MRTGQKKLDVKVLRQNRSELQTMGTRIGERKIMYVKGRSEGVTKFQGAIKRVKSTMITTGFKHNIFDCICAIMTKQG